MAHTRPILPALLILLILTTHLRADTIAPATPNNNSSISFSGVDLASLLQSLGMTQNDLNNLRDSVNAGNSSAASQSPTTNSSVSAVSAASSASLAGSNMSQPISKSAAVESESVKLTDLSELQKQLGIITKSVQNVNVSTAPSTTQTKAITIENASTLTSSAAQAAVKSIMPQVNGQATQSPTTSTQQNLSQSAPSASTTATASTTAAASSSYDFLSQFNSLATATSAGVVPLNAPISSSSQFSVLPGFMDLTSLQQQLGLLTKPAAVIANQSKSLQPDSNRSSASSQPAVVANTSEVKNSTSAASTRNASTGLNQSANNNSAASTQSTSASTNSSASPAQNTASNDKPSAVSPPASTSTANATKADSQPQTASVDKIASINDQTKLLQNLADLQKLLDQLSSNKTAPKDSTLNQTTSRNSVNATAVSQPVTQNNTNQPASNSVANTSQISNQSNAKLPNQPNTNITQPTQQSAALPIIPPIILPTQQSNISAANSVIASTINSVVTSTANSIVATTTNAIASSLTNAQLNANTVAESVANAANSIGKLPAPSNPIQTTNTEIRSAQPPISNQPTIIATQTQATTNVIATQSQGGSSASKADSSLSRADQSQTVQDSQKTQSMSSQSNQPQFYQPAAPVQNTQAAAAAGQIQSAQQISRPVATQAETNTFTQYLQPQVVISRLDPKFYGPNQVSSNYSSQTTRNNQQQSSIPNQNANTVYISPLQVPQNNLQTQTVTQQYPVNNSPPIVQPTTMSMSDVQSYQQMSGSNLAVYSLNASYKQFAGSFVMAINDANLPAIRTYLSTNYGAYLNQGSIVSGFRQFSTYDDSIDYQLLYKTIYGTFNAILNYNLATDAIVLKSLSVINFFILEIDVSNCMVKDSSQNSCRVCNGGYRNFMGRCRQVDSRCVQYLTDECGACMGGFRLLRGVCV